MELTEAMQEIILIGVLALITVWSIYLDNRK